MSSVTFLTVQNEALGNDFDATLYRTSVKRWINEGLGRIARRSHLPGSEFVESFSTVAGTATHNLPADDVRVLGLRTTDDQSPLAFVETAVVDEWPAARGRPSAYSAYGTVLTLYPVPDAVYTLQLRYLREPTSLSLDADTAGIPDSYVDALVAWARYKLFRAEDDIQAAQFWRGEFESSVAELRADLQRRNVSGVKQVPSMWAQEPTPRFQFPA
jgi:hypothetical protein